MVAKSALSMHSRNLSFLSTSRLRGVRGSRICGSPTRPYTLELWNVGGLSSFSVSFLFCSSVDWLCRLIGGGNENFRRGVGVIFSIVLSWRCRRFDRAKKNGGTIHW